MVLIGCEESQTICGDMRAAGIEAYSCDLEPTRGHPDWHIQADVMEVLARGWRLAILHPPCTALTYAGNRWYGKGMEFNHEREAAIEWTMKLWALAKSSCDMAAMENPRGVIWDHIRPGQVVQPWEFGDPFSKAHILALHNLPPLMATLIETDREQACWKMGPSPTRSRDRSKTYPGISQAITDQWGCLV